ncbi:MAG: hypothetical protein ACRELG_30225 [Gemmataceae bacterium]
MPMRLAPPRLRTIRFEDYPIIQRLEAAHLPTTLPADEWPRLWLDNPLWPRRGNHWPIGWVLEDASGRVVGSLPSFPSLYRFRGQDLVCAIGRNWVVSPEYRSFAPWLMEEYFNQPGVDLFINTTVKPNAVPIVSTFATRVPVGDWETIAYRITDYRGFARKALQKRQIPLARAVALPVSAALWLKDALFATPLPGRSAGVVVKAVEGFDSRFDLFWEELVRQNPDKLLAARDSRSLTWHYAIAMRQGRLSILTAVHNGLLRAYCVLHREEWTDGIRRMSLFDYQTLEPGVDLLPELLRAAVKRCAAEGFDVLDHLGCGLAKMRSFDSFARHRWKTPNWPFYYQAAEPVLAAELRRPEVWDPSAFDGDASIG